MTPVEYQLVLLLWVAGLSGVCAVGALLCDLIAMLFRRR